MAIKHLSYNKGIRLSTQTRKSLGFLHNLHIWNAFLFSSDFLMKNQHSTSWEIDRNWLNKMSGLLHVNVCDVVSLENGK